MKLTAPFLALVLTVVWPYSSVFASTHGVETQDMPRTNLHEQRTLRAAPPRNGDASAKRQAYAVRVRHAALLAPVNEVELGLLSAARWGASEKLELSLHPLWFFILPRVQAKVLWKQFDAWTLSSRHELSVPSLFLDLIAREGTGGLLDPTQPAPLALLTEHGMLLTWRAGPSHWLTVEPFVQWRMGESGPILDFPFFYQRFAALESIWTAGAGFGAEGAIWSFLGYHAELRYTRLPLQEVPGAYALEGQLEARLLVSEGASLPIGLRAARAHFPIGVRTHWFPYADFRFAW